MAVCLCIASDHDCFKVAEFSTENYTDAYKTNKDDFTFLHVAS